jgi:3-phenylpropionate/cinnamic acid dioxygenase small subunit
MPATYPDRESIRELTARYNLAADSRDLDGYADCFTEDGAFEIVGLARLEGQEPLKAMIGALDFPTLHVSADAVIDVDGDTATQRCAFMLFARKPEANDLVVLTTARYTDRLVRTAQGWRFTERVAHPDNDLGFGIAQLSPAFAAAMAATAGA